MDLSKKIEVEESLLASQGRSPEAWRKPERDLSTPRGKLLWLSDFAAAIPDEKLDMRLVCGREGRDCGCVWFHMHTQGYEERSNQWNHKELGMTEVEMCALFCVGDVGRKAYPVPTGAPAKAEFLRRIDAVLATSQS